MVNEKNAKQYVEKILEGSKIDDITKQIDLINSYEKVWIANSISKKGMIKDEFSGGNAVSSINNEI